MEIVAGAVASHHQPPGGCAATEKLRKFQTEFLFYLTPFDAHEANEGGRGREKAQGVWLVPNASASPLHFSNALTRVYLIAAALVAC